MGQIIWKTSLPILFLINIADFKNITILSGLLKQRPQKKNAANFLSDIVYYFWYI